LSITMLPLCIYHHSWKVRYYCQPSFQVSCKIQVLLFLWQRSKNIKM